MNLPIPISAWIGICPGTAGICAFLQINYGRLVVIGWEWTELLGLELLLCFALYAVFNLFPFPFWCLGKDNSGNPFSCQWDRVCSVKALLKNSETMLLLKQFESNYPVTLICTFQLVFVSALWVKVHWIFKV